jgi:formate dehydrogenase major subunit
VVTPGGNLSGLRQAGIGTGNSSIADQINSGRIKGVFVFGEDPVGAGLLSIAALNKLELLVAVSPWINETARAADVVLPGGTPLESSGTYIGCDGKCRSFSGVQEPPAGLDNLQVISALAEALGVPIRGERRVEAASAKARLALPEDTAIFRTAAVTDPALCLFNERLARQGL